MAARQAFEVETCDGVAVGTPEPPVPGTLSVFRDEWHLATPWGDRRFFGTTSEAKKELTAMVREQGPRPE